MKILHIGYSDTKGGAAIAMMRLHNSLIQQNIDSKVLVAEKLSNDPNVIGPTKSLDLIINNLKQILVRQKKYIFKNNEQYSHSINFFRSNILKKISEINPDIVNLHWVNNELLSIGQIGNIKKPLVWTFVDMWPMCGGEHYTDSQRYKVGYLKNNNNNTSKGIDLNKFLWQKKKKKWNLKINNIVCISEWLKNKTKESYLFKNSNIIKINCYIDLKVWKPIDQKIARNILDLPQDKKLFLFVSTNGINDKRKGFNFIDSSLNNLLIKRDDFELIILGNGRGINKKSYNYRVVDKIFDGNPIELRLLYSACDLVLAPSTLEAFGQVALEASACGIPSVAFRRTGIEDIIEHKTNGYLANYLDQDDFNKGIDWTLNELINEKDKIFNNCLKIVNEKISDELISKKYIELYRSIKQ